MCPMPKRACSTSAAASSIAPVERPRLDGRVPPRLGSAGQRRRLGLCVLCPAVAAFARARAELAVVPPPQMVCGRRKTCRCSSCLSDSILRQQLGLAAFQRCIFVLAFGPCLRRPFLRGRMEGWPAGMLEIDTLGRRLMLLRSGATFVDAKVLAGPPCGARLQHVALRYTAMCVRVFGGISGGVGGAPEQSCNRDRVPGIRNPQGPLISAGIIYSSPSVACPTSTLSLLRLAGHGASVWGGAIVARGRLRAHLHGLLQDDPRQRRCQRRPG